MVGVQQLFFVHVNTCNGSSSWFAVYSGVRRESVAVYLQRTYALFVAYGNTQRAHALCSSFGVLVVCLFDLSSVGQDR